MEPKLIDQQQQQQQQKTRTKFVESVGGLQGANETQNKQLCCGVATILQQRCHGPDDCHSPRCSSFRVGGSFEILFSSFVLRARTVQ